MRVNESEITHGSGPRQNPTARSALLVITAVVALSGASGCLNRDLQSGHNARSQRLCLVGLTNGTVLQGQVTLPFSFRPCDSESIYFVVNEGASPMGVTVEATRTGGGVVRWQTDDFENGLYDVYLEADLGERTIFSTTNTLIVSNAISFDSWRVCGTQMWVFARLAVPHADWKVKVFEEGSNYLGNFVGSTTNGLINFIWDLKSVTGAALTNANSFTLEYSFEPVGSSKPIIPLIHPNPMIAPSVYTDPTPWKLRPPD